ncbi:MAG: response regulator [Anaerolineae bacterium]|nr:response regulator [Anaerolineae bacterium]
MSDEQQPQEQGQKKEQPEKEVTPASQETPPPQVAAAGDVPLAEAKPDPADASKAEAKPAPPTAAPKPPTTAPEPSAVASEPPTAAPPVETRPDTPVEPAKPAGLPRALVVDDEPANRDFLVRLLMQANMEVTGASSAEEALKIAADIDDMALVVIDNKLPDKDGVELLVEFRKRYPNARMVMATMLDERAVMDKAFENGCNVFLVKPHGFMELFQRLQKSAEPGKDDLNQMIIDQYGPRPYRK